MKPASKRKDKKCNNKFMLRASGMMAFHIYWSISIFCPFQWLQYGFKSQAAVKKKKQTVDAAVPRGAGPVAAKSQNSTYSNNCAQVLHRKNKSRRWVRWRATSVGKRVKPSIPGKCRAGLLTGFCFYVAWLLRRRNQK